VSREIYEFSDFRLDPARRRLEGPGGAVVQLTAKPFDALVHLIENAGEPVSRKALMLAVWPDTIVEDNNLTQAISTLRSALGKRYIVTLPGRGYQFIGDVRVVSPGPVALKTPGEAADSDSPAGTVPGPKRGRWRAAGLAAAAVAVAVVGVRLFTVYGHAPEAPTATLQNSIAILPFENLSPDPDNAYYAAGLHEEILNQLARLRSLNVVSRNSVLRYAENRPPITEIARELGVEAIMQGSIRFAGERIRVAMQLVDGRSGRNVWSETYESDFADVFGVESDIARNVAESLNVEFSRTERDDLQVLPTGSSEAYALYLRAWNTGGIAVRDDKLLDQALALDPDFAQAHALKALVNSRRLINIAGTDAVEAAQRSDIEDIVRRHATRAIEIDPNVPYAHAALGTMYRYRWYWNAAVEEYLEAVDAMPSDLSARQGLAWSLGWLGRHEEAIEQAQLGIDLNPLNANALYYIAPVYAYAGDYDSAIEVIRRAQQLIPSNPVVQAWLGFMETARRNNDAAILALRRAEKMLGDNPSTVFLPEFAHAYSLLGLRQDVDRIYAMIMERAKSDDSLGSGTWAQTYLAIGDYDRALEWLEVIATKAQNHIIDEATINVLHLKMNYMNDPVLRQPRFVEVFSRIQGA
jgi:TolB-like protein/DNA-binding winged helix-turn-helix (wHTH) protein/Flp pilus assembly protein TadD